MNDGKEAKKPVEGDAFALFGQALEEHKDLAGRFEGGEHQWLGTRGMLEACAVDPSLGPPLRGLKRHAKDVALTYGEIVALSGDFYRYPKDLFEERPAALPWLYEANDLSDLRQVFRSELAWIEKENRPISAGYPDNNFTLMWNAKSYVELALDNKAHFGWHNVLAYCSYHREALGFAIAAKAQSDADESWIRALYYNGFADHFLTDGFAAGHVRVPRAEIIEWAASIGYDAKLAGALSKLIHDQDGHVNTAHAHGESKLPDSEGLPVRNSLGANWSTRCDGQLFLVQKNTNSDLVGQPVAAVKESLLELGRAFKTKRHPDGVYEALKHVPFPRPGSPSLASKFPATMPESAIAELVDGTTWYLKLPWVGTGLNAAAVRRLLQALPELMTKFAANVASTYQATPELQLRLPAPYIEAFRTIA